MQRLLTWLVGVFLLIGAGLLVAIAAQPVALATQYLMVATFLGIFLVAKLFRPQGFLRLVLIGMAVILVARYLIWRTLYTIPSPEEPVTFLFGALLYAAELYTITMLLINLFVIIDPLERRGVSADDDESLPSVDVFVPSYNESDEMLANTLCAAVSMDYPADRLRVWLLDDGATAEKRNDPDPEKARAARERGERLRRLCERLGVRYHAREANVSAKAGNLNDAFGISDGELIAVFDADHMPVRTFLRRTVGHFLEDDKLFLVQTPHSFINYDPLERNLGVGRSMPSENYMFYHFVQRGLDRWGASFFCGSAAVLSRRALEHGGGFSGISVTEDAETALDLHALGYRSRYIDEPLITGLQPESFSDFLGQRTRWLQGMIQIFLLKNPVVKKGLTLAQRLCYLSVQLFWLFPFSRLMFFIAPLVFLFAGLEIYAATFGEFLAYTVPYMVVTLSLSDYIYGRVRRTLVSDLYETIQSAHLFRALLGVIARPRAPSFGVTAKGRTLAHSHISPSAWPLFLLAAAVFAGGVVTLARLALGVVDERILAVVGGFNAVNLVILMAALGVVGEHAQRRVFPRIPLARTVELGSAGRCFEAQVADISPSGARLIVPVRATELDLDDLAIREALEAEEVPRHWLGVERVHHEPVVEGTALRVRFAPFTLAERRHWIELMHRSSAPLQAMIERRVPAPGTLKGLLWFAGVGVRGFLATLGIALRSLLRRRKAGATGTGVPAAKPRLRRAGVVATPRESREAA